MAQSGADCIDFRRDIVAFATSLLHFSLDPIQTDVLRKDPHRCIFNCSRQWGKSTVTAIKALHQAVFFPNSLTLVLGPSERQSAELVEKITALSLSLDFKPKGDGRNPISLRFPNMSRIVGLPPNESTVRGFSSVALLLIDEASRVPDDVYHCVRPMIAVSNGAIWLISTPNGRRGFFYETWSSHDPAWTRVSVKGTECPRLTHKFLQEERAVHGERKFRQEYLCEFHDQDGQLLSSEVLERALTHDVKPLDIPPLGSAPRPDYHRVNVTPRQKSDPLSDRLLRSKLYVAIDFGEITQSTTIAVIEKSHWLTGQRNHWDYERDFEERFSLRLLERIMPNTPYKQSIARLGQIVRSMGSSAECSMTANVTASGSVVLDQIRELQTGRRLYPVIITDNSEETLKGCTNYVPRRFLFSQLAQQFETGQYRISSDLELAPTLIEELSSLRSKLGVTQPPPTLREGRHDDLVYALSLATWVAIKDAWRPSK